MKKSGFIRICLKCKNKQEVMVSKKEIVFGLIDYDKIFEKECSKCGYEKFKTTYQKINLDFELLEEWSLNPDLYLMEQDEELFLADEFYVDIILQVLDTVKMLDTKRNLLLEALCIIVYDNTIENNQYKDDKLRKRVIKELNKRKELLKLAEDWIGGYIKAVVYPLLATGKKD